MASSRPLRILVPRLIDRDNHNAQNLNAKALLARFASPDVIWHVYHYNDPDASVAARGNVRCHRLVRSRLWQQHMVLAYQRGEIDAIFYPGNECFDMKALDWRERLGRKVPVIATLEGLPGDAEREKLLSAKAGRPVYCFAPRSGPEWTRCHDAVHRLADRCIAISPHLARMGECLYGKPMAALPIGVDTAVFNDTGRVSTEEPPEVICVGTLYDAKRPELFLRMAREYPGARFTWCGEGPLREGLVRRVLAQGLANLAFPGPTSHADLARRYREASLFVLPSLSEGVPKAAMEAAACGLPLILFGHYEPPIVNHGDNGFLVWSDDELMFRLGELLRSRDMRESFGRSGARMAASWSWDRVAGQWEPELIGQIDAALAAAWSRHGLEGRAQEGRLRRVGKSLSAAARSPDKIYYRAVAHYYERRRAALFRRHFIQGDKRDAILIASYPKSGNTLFRFIWLNLINQMELHEDRVDFRLLDRHLPSDQYLADLAAPWPFRSLPCLLKTHRPYMDAFRPFRAVHLFRNPFDTMVSAYHYFSKRTGGPTDSGLSLAERALFDNIERFEGGISEFIAANIDACLEHFLSWAGSGAVPVSYSDLISGNGDGVLESVFERLGLEVDRAHLRTAFELSHRDRVGKYESSEKMARLSGTRFVRNGSEGQWASELTPADMALIGERMRHHGLDERASLPEPYAAHLRRWREILASAGVSMNQGSGG